MSNPSSAFDPLGSVPEQPPAALACPVFLADLRAQMLKFAVLQLADRSQAEDAVQEALEGALKNSAAFNRQAALKTWVFAILKHKITDTLRRRHKADQAVAAVQLDDDEADDSRFDHKGRWQRGARPARWQQPEQTMEDAHFWRTFDACLNCLPALQARLFMMREFLELSSDEICAQEAITVSNLHVVLYRARLRLRDCLENNWFSEGK